MPRALPCLPPRPLALMLMLGGLLPSPALAGTHWMCGLSGELTRLVCVADADAHEATDVRASTAVVNGTRFPLDTRQLWVVDLWSPPTEGATVEWLARATLCYRTAGCSVTVALPAYLRASATP